MSTLGIVAEYDPFHRGHDWHLSRARQIVQPDWTCVVLSPCYKQRGTLSLLSPHDRARCAVRAGADAVFLLPVSWTVRDAEHYALGAVSLLTALGCTHLAFGAETDDLRLLQQIAMSLEEEPAPLRQSLREGLSAGLGYPAAMARAVSSLLPQAESVLSRPNNLLAVCYLRALLRLSSPMAPVLIPRRGDYHAPAVDADFPSASAIREALLQGNYRPAYAAVPEETGRLLRERILHRQIPDAHVEDALLLSALRGMTISQLQALPDLSEGLETALRRAASSCSSRLELVEALTGRRYPAARIHRLCASVLLGLTREAVDNAPLPDRTLLLALRKHPAMTESWKSLPIRIASSAREWVDLADPADLVAWRIWAQCCHRPDTLPCTEMVYTES